MTRPVVGIIGNHHLINDQYETHAGGRMNSEAVRDVCDALPLIVPSDPTLVDIADLVATCDGFLFTGGRPNVHPEEYGEEYEYKDEYGADKPEGEIDEAQHYYST